jgi:hypothetical protein
MLTADGLAGALAWRVCQPGPAMNTNSLTGGFVDCQENLPLGKQPLISRFSSPLPLLKTKAFCAESFRAHTFRKVFCGLRVLVRTKCTNKIGYSQLAELASEKPKIQIHPKALYAAAFFAQ